MTTPPATHHLSAAEAAARLGVKRETLYAYVSRGLLQRTLSLDGRTSLFDPGEIDSLRSSRRRSADGEITTVIASSITRVDEQGHAYREIPVADLLDHRFEAVADLLWDRTGEWRACDELLATVSAAQATLAADVPLIDRMRLSIVVASALDPLRGDPSPEAMAQAGRVMLTVMVDGLPGRGDDPAPGSGLTTRLWSKLTDLDGAEAQRGCLETAFVLLADHGLAASTFAARIAASVRADPYSIALAGMGAVGGVLHGAASSTVHQLVDSAARSSPAAALGRLLANGTPVPGIGHRVYRTVDPRAIALFDRIEAAWNGDPRLDVLAELRLLVTDRAPEPVNIDFALGALTWLAGMEPAHGTSIFIARTAGWIAHGIEEYGEKPVRFRPVARYAGPRPKDVPEIGTTR